MSRNPTAAVNPFPIGKRQVSVIRAQGTISLSDGMLTQGSSGQKET